MRVWQQDRVDIPETWWDAAVYLDKLKKYSHQTRGYYEGRDAWDIYNEAHGEVNEEMRTGRQYVSTYRGD